jgi:protein-disulfide isomerase
MRQLISLNSNILATSIVALIVLSGCTDTTGLSAESSKGPHPDSTANSPIVVTKFADLQCGACRAAHSKVVEPLLKQFGDKIRYEFKHFPLRAIHPYALTAAQATECAADQEKFWDYVDQNFENQQELTNSIHEDWAEKLGLNVELFNKCLESEIKKDTVLADFKEGETLGVTGTPTFFVNGTKVKSNIQSIDIAIQEALSGS